jgi:hypothetical protein
LRKGFDQHSQRIAGASHPKNGFFAIPAQLGELDAAIPDHHDVTSRLTLREKGLIAREEPLAGKRRNL